MRGTETRGSDALAATAPNQRQETAIRVQLVPGIRFLAIDFGAELRGATLRAGTVHDQLSPAPPPRPLPRGAILCPIKRYAMLVAF